MCELHEISLRERIRLNLISAMEQANINQVQLAEKLGISKGTVNNWARGNNSPDVDMVPRICSVLGISILDLFSPTKFESQENVQAKNSSSTDEATPGENLQKLNALASALEQLNEEGQDKLVDYAEDLVASGRYIKSDKDRLDNKKYA